MPTPLTDACEESNEEALVIKAGTVAAMRSDEENSVHGYINI